MSTRGYVVSGAGLLIALGVAIIAACNKDGPTPSSEAALSEDGLSENVLAEDPAPYFGQWQVMYLESDEHAGRMAERIAKATGRRLLPNQYNPVCCLWVQRWSPTGADGNFLWVARDGGGMLLVSDDEGLDKALEWIASLPVDAQGNPVLPIGVATNMRTWPTSDI